MHGGDKGKLSNSPKFRTSKEGNSHRDEKSICLLGHAETLGHQVDSDLWALRSFLSHT